METNKSHFSLYLSGSDLTMTNIGDKTSAVLNNKYQPQFQEAPENGFFVSFFEIDGFDILGVETLFKDWAEQNSFKILTKVSMEEPVF